MRHDLHDEDRQRQLLHSMVDGLPARMLAATLALLQAGPRYLHSTRWESQRPAPAP